MLAITRLRAAGYRRLGLVLTEDFSRRVNFAYEAAFALQQQMGELPRLPGLTINTIEAGRSLVAIKSWARKNHPEIILTLQNGLLLLREALPHNFPGKICLLDHDGRSPLSGIDQHPVIIGEAAIDLLAGQVQRGEVGFEEHPRVTMIEGAWTTGR
jgi:LacI family transcriptional regulator